MCIIWEVVNTQTVSFNYFNSASALLCERKVQLAVRITLILKKFSIFQRKGFGEEAERTNNADLYFTNPLHH